MSYIPPSVSNVFKYDTVNESEFIFEVSHPRCVCKLDRPIVGKCSPTQLCQLMCLITIAQKTTCFGTRPSSGFISKSIVFDPRYFERKTDDGLVLKHVVSWVTVIKHPNLT
jgi:hypothetical protein